MDQNTLDTSLAAGDAWVTHLDRPEREGRRVGVTVTLMKIPPGLFQVSVDTYFVEGLYGNDISWELMRFETLEDALGFLKFKVGISATSLHKRMRRNE